MKNINRYAFGLALVLGMVLAAAGFAQTVTQADQKKTTESCGAMACCSHDSASMKDAKEHSAKPESCCAGDSCKMKMKEGAKSQMDHSTMAGCCGCCGDSCDMKMKDGAKKMNHSDMAGCCGCCGDSCDMKMKEGAKNQMDHSTMAGCCGCCGDSCEKEMKHKEKTN